MKRLLIVTTVLALVVAPAGVAAVSPDNVQNAAKACKKIRADLGASTFKQTYGTNKNKANAFGKCVSKQAKVDKQVQSNAAKDCKTEQAADPEAFKNKYGTNKNKTNAFGKCVSAKAKQQSEAQQAAVVNAAKLCKAERAAGPEAFKNKYGTNKNKNNAFGKCVSTNAKAG